MNFNAFLFAQSLGVLISVVTPAHAADVHEKRNVLIISDDHRWDAIGAAPSRAG